MKTYSFKVVVEPDEDRWHAYCPALVNQGAATWGYTEQEALQQIQEVVQIVVESLVEQVGHDDATYPLTNTSSDHTPASRIPQPVPSPCSKSKAS